MFLLWINRLTICSLIAAWCLACAPTLRSQPPGALASDPTPLSRCSVGAGAENPLVTEWEASEKASLEGLLSLQPVAVRFSGCELKVVERCFLPGAYTWIRTTLATDSVEIRSEDELYAKLPVGAAKLEAVLSQRGSLTVRTRVAGQLRLTGPLPQIPQSPECSAATHVVSAVSLGAFQLLEGAQAKRSATLGTSGAQLGGSSDEAVEVLRAAGDDEACRNTSKEAADPGCASPLQLFLSPIESAASSRENAGPGAVKVTFPSVQDQTWSLYDKSEQLLCATPCARWVPPKSGYELRSKQGRVQVPDRLGFAAGQYAVADFSPRRGSPVVAKWLFWGLGAWTIFPGTVGAVFGIQAATAEAPDCDPQMDIFCEDKRENAAFWITSSAVFLATFGATLYYYVISEEESFSLHPHPQAGSARRQPLFSLQLGPHFVRGTF